MIQMARIANFCPKVKTLRRPQNLKKSPTWFNKTAVLSSIKTSGRFFQTFVAFSEKLNFIRQCITICHDIKDNLLVGNNKHSFIQNSLMKFH
jgi:hypothetical protein